MALDAISFPPVDGSPPQRLFAMLHGWGANARDLAALAPLLDIDECQMVFAEAPFPHPQIPGGRMWYDLETRDRDQLAHSRKVLVDWLNALAAETGVPLERTILGGFSQGGAMTLDVGLDSKLAGLCCLSGYLHEPGYYSIPNVDSYPPLLMVHGTFDPVVSIEIARRGKAILENAGVDVAYHELEMQHEIPPSVLPLISQFVRDRTWQS